MAMLRSHQTAQRRLPARKLLSGSRKALACGAVIVAFGAVVATPAGADPNSGGGDPDPFGGLSCSCSQSAPADSPVSKQQIIQGIRHGLSGQGAST